MLNLIQTDEFTSWLKRLKDINAQARINIWLKRISLTGNLGNTESVGDSVYELRIDYGPGCRVYYAQRGEEILLLLIGGGKSSQQKSIERAKKFNAECE